MTRTWHPCSRKHRTAKALAACRWPKACWISEEKGARGAQRAWACVSPCVVTSVSLWPSREDAESCKWMIDKYACGHRCTPSRHYVIELDARRWD